MAHKWHYTMTGINMADERNIVFIYDSDKLTDIQEQMRIHFLDNNIEVNEIEISYGNITINGWSNAPEEVEWRFDIYVSVPPIDYRIAKFHQHPIDFWHNMDNYTSFPN